MPTLIVIDYAARDTERTGRLLWALAGRGAADGTLRLAAPVRVLLVERTGEGDWLNKIVGTGTTKGQVNATHAPNLPLATISDSWPIFEFVLNKVKKPVPDKAETLATFGAIDPERRPLFAYFMADAIAAGHDVRHFDAARLLDQVIERGREAYWKPAGATAKEERLLALATMAGGLSVSSVKGLKEELLSSWNVDLHPKVFLAMTGRESGESVSPLEPDIVGEHFALACLAQTNLSNEDRSRLCGLAWELGSHSMAQFILRAHRDLPTHPMLNWVRKLPTSEGLPQFFWAVAAVNLMVDLGSSDPDAARALLGVMRGIAAAHDAPPHWELWATATVNLMLDFGSRDPSAARALLDDLRRVATARDEPPLWELWAKSAYNLMHALQSRDPDAVWVLLDDLRRVATARNEPPVWREWAEAAYNLTNILGSRDPSAARALLDDLRRVAAARDEPPLWEIWTKAAVNLMFDLQSRDLDAARALLDHMHDMATEHDEVKLWIAWAKAAVNQMVELQSRDLDAARALLDHMHDMATEHDEVELWIAWAKSAANLMFELQSRDSDAARALLDDLRRVATARDEPTVWREWAKAAHNLMLGLQSRDPDAGRALLNDIRSMAIVRDEIALWELWSKAAANLMFELQSCDQDAAQALAAEVLLLPPEILSQLGIPASEKNH